MFRRLTWMLALVLALVVDLWWLMMRGNVVLVGGLRLHNPGLAQARKLEQRQGAVAIFEATADQRGSWATLTGEAHRGQSRLLR